MNRSTLHFTLGCVGALAVGALAGSWVTGSPRLEVPAASTAPSASADPAGRTASEALKEAVRTASGERRWLLLASAAEHATAQDMPALIRLAGEDSAAASMIAARWAELDPKHMLAIVYADFLLPDGSPVALPGRWNLTRALVESWSKRDPAGMVKALNEIPKFSGLESLRTSAASELCKGDVELGLRAMKEWNIRNYIPDLKKFGEWAKSDPKRAVDLAVEFGREYVAREALKQAGKSWGQSDPEGALRHAAKLRTEPQAALSDEVMTQWAGRDLKAAVAFATAQEDPTFRAALAQGLMKEWGKTDAAGALAWSQENLRGQARNEAIAGLIGAAAQKDLHAAGALVAGMEPGPAQNRACASLFETWFKKGKEHRDAAFEWLAQLPDETARRNALERVQWDWSWREPEAVRDFIKGPYGKLASESVIQLVSRNLTSKNPESAMEWAKSLPASQADAAQGAVFDSWLTIRPDGVAEYARNLPAGPERDRAIQRIAQNFAYQSPKRAADWYHTLPTGDAQEKAKAAFETVGLNVEKRAELNKALEGK